MVDLTGTLRRGWERPTLDGMGPVGEGAHAPHESLLKRSLMERTVLLAGMIASMS